MKKYLLLYNENEQGYFLLFDSILQARNYVLDNAILIYEIYRLYEAEYGKI